MVLAIFNNESKGPGQQYSAIRYRMVDKVLNENKIAEQRKFKIKKICWV